MDNKDITTRELIYRNPNGKPTLHLRVWYQRAYSYGTDKLTITNGDDIALTMDAATARELRDALAYLYPEDKTVYVSGA